MSYHLRPATDDDPQGLFETQVSAFGEEEGTLRWERALLDALFPRTQAGSGPWG
jgi:hypothetical protein